MLHLKNGEHAGIITNIQKYTIHDGPGIRTEIFFKGCTMHCKWCSNPETIAPHIELGMYPTKCVRSDKCGLCLKVCPEEGEMFGFDGDCVLSSLKTTGECESCLRCADVCPNHAIKQWGELMTVEELMKVIRADVNFYNRSGGGVTLNGGEVLVQWEFAAELLKKCREESIQTCVETALNVPTEHMERVYEYTDVVITDIKQMDSAKHREYTGAGNELILKNIRRTVELGKKLIIRTPVVPFHNDSEEDFRRIGEFVRDELGGNIVQYQLLSYKRMGTEKYASLMRPYPMEDFVQPEREVCERNILFLAEMLREEYGVPAVAGSSAKIVL
ncbi:MAG: glycyl-radical enzyme activating protein [Oscillospiraceae bacterium]|nr:glycyl-radical enzyme activating protein [Oscillospiraceae bacterium]